VYRFSLPSILVLALVCSAVPARAQQAPQSRQGVHVWTNADMDNLRARGLISIVPTERPAAPAAAAAPTPTPGPVYASRTQDPAWYAEQAADLQTQLRAHQDALAQAQNNLAQARSLQGTTGSINMAAGDTFGVTPEAVIANLETQVRETQGLLDQLADLARRNDIPPGVLRSTPA
jgi:hypothetical protein